MSFTACGLAHVEAVLVGECEVIAVRTVSQRSYAVRVLQLPPYHAIVATVTIEPSFSSDCS